MACQEVPAQQCLLEITSHCRPHVIQQNDGTYSALASIRAFVSLIPLSEERTCIGILL